jgi:hypothetical protein
LIHIAIAEGGVPAAVISNIRFTTEASAGCTTRLMAERIGLVSERDTADVGETAAPQAGPRITKSLADDLAFELRKGGEHVEDEIAHGEIAEMNVPSDDHELRSASLKRPSQSRPVRDAPGQSIKAVDHDAVHAI